MVSISLIYCSHILLLPSSQLDVTAFNRFCDLCYVYTYNYYRTQSKSSPTDTSPHNFPGFFRPFCPCKRNTLRYSSSHQNIQMQHFPNKAGHNVSIRCCVLLYLKDLREALTWTRYQCMIQKDEEKHVFDSRRIGSRKYSAIHAQTFTIRRFVFTRNRREQRGK